MRVVFCLHTVRVFVHSVISFPGIFLPPEVKTYLLGVSLRVSYLCVCVCVSRCVSSKPYNHALTFPAQSCV